MAKFEFKSNLMEFSFPNNILVKIPYEQEFFEKMQEKGKRLLEISEGDIEDVNYIVNELMDIIDEILDEEGIADRIFGNREPNIYDCRDIIEYIKEEAMDYIKKRADNSPELNRKQRRAVSKNGKSINRQTAGKRNNRGY